ncbi:hypothetical protein GCK72_024581 [Caenorhabditis remanei]|uniref:Uncharacterized protein n=1 Tax=Caenorhabditis remanei TaxID=31234 RepID=A0A6A5G0C5_CAERE|nr:hypothetical protein GCK72_024581 [Caenorhabditis remanei]KAF1748114.1 hypothetical protein GCK72_024581 [Caenorhabditis remanei]
MSPRFITILLLICLVSGVTAKFLAVVDETDVIPEEPLVEEEREMCFCCRAFVCRHQTCPCSRFTALF